MGKIQIMYNKRLITSIVSFSLALFTLSPLQAGVYKWVDENGQVHYGAQPGNAGAEKINIRHNETTKPRAIKKDEKDSDKKAEKPAEAKVPKIPKKEKRRLCNEAKSDLAAIASRGRMREINKKGEYIYLSDAQKQQRIAAAKKKKREFCR